MTCFFCDAPAIWGPFDGVSACDDCAKLIAALALNNPSPAWSVAESGSMPQPFGNHGESLAYFQEMLGKPKLIGKAWEQPLPWAELVAAYTDRHLYHLAVRTCALALKQGNTMEKGAVLSKLLTPPLLNTDGLAVLKRLIRPKPADGKDGV